MFSVILKVLDSHRNKSTVYCQCALTLNVLTTEFIEVLYCIFALGFKTEGYHFYLMTLNYIN